MTKPHICLTTTRLLCLWLGLINLPMSAVATTWTNQQPADLVLGQANFTTAASGVTANTLNHPVAVAIDPTSNKVFVSDYNNCRVLRFGSVTSLTNGAAAEAVLGQPNFTSGTCTISATGLDTLGGITVDSAGRLWVADFNNNRVLRFDNASTIATGAAANGVLGQPDFTSNGFSVVTPSTLHWPKSVAVDSAGRLWVADQSNSRVLRFDNAASKANGATADGVLGKPDFTSSGGNLTQNGMNGPEGITIDSAGNLFVADLNNHRVLRFNNAAAKANGANADAVLGQPDFTSGATTTSATGTGLVRGVAIDSLGQLYVSDADNNNRILVYQNAATLSNGAAASYVLGQPDFTSNTANNGGVSATSLSFPFGLFFDNANDSLWVADFNNSRVLRYALPEIQILDGATDLPLNSTVNLGTTNVGSPIYKNLTIKDLGNGTLTLTGLPIVSITGTEFAATTSPAASIVPANSSTFTLQFNPGTVGNFTGSLSMVNNDRDENPFILSLQGTAVGLPQTLTFTLPTVATVGDAPLALSATATSGLPVTFASTTPGVCTVSGTTLFIVSAGTCTVMAVQVGNTTYNAASQVAQMTINLPPPPLPPMTLKVSLSGTGTGRITSDVGGIDCSPTSSSCTYTVNTPIWVTLTALPGDGSQLTSWTGDPACTATGQVLILQDTACTAEFTLQSYQLTGNFLGKGRVTGPGIDCPGQCTATYLYGTTVTLKAQATRKMWEFSSWRGCDSQGHIKITNDALCQAVFTPDPNIPNAGDSNGDGLKDADQDNVVSLPDKVTGTYLTLETQPATCIISDIYPDLAEAQTIKLDSTKKFPQGMLYFDIACPQAQVSVYYHGMSKLSRNLKFYKFGPKIPGDLTTIGWYQLPNVKYELVTIGGQPVVKGTYTLTDGELGDSTGVDGHIVDPGGVVSP